jgi:hypothetical protein
VDDREAGDGAGQRDVQAVQAAGLAGGDSRRLHDDDLVELQALGQGDRHHGQRLAVAVPIQDRVGQAGLVEDRGQPGDLIVGRDHRRRTWPGERVGARARQRAGEGAGRGLGDHERARVLAHGRRRFEAGGYEAEQPAGEVKDLARHPVAGVEDPQPRILFAEVTEHLLPAGRRPRRGALGDVAEHGGRPGGTTAAERAALHRRQVLGLVHDHVRQARCPLDQVARLVDQHRVSGRPARGTRPARRPGPADRGLLVGIQQVARCPGQQAGIG